MSNLQIDPVKVSEIIERLQTPLSAQDMDFWVEAHALLGYWSATQMGAAELAESERKYAEAEEFKRAKEEDPKSPAALLEAKATLATFDKRKAEIRARTNALKLKNLWFSVEQCINALKWLSETRA